MAGLRDSHTRRKTVLYIGDKMKTLALTREMLSSMTALAPSWHQGEAGPPMQRVAGDANKCKLQPL